jgi:hypothetical protein
MFGDFGRESEIPTNLKKDKLWKAIMERYPQSCLFATVEKKKKG